MSALEFSYTQDELRQLASEVLRYATAEHGFHCDDRPAVFDAAAAGDAWTKTLEWFDAHVAR